MNKEELHLQKVKKLRIGLLMVALSLFLLGNDKVKWFNSTSIKESFITAGVIIFLPLGIYFVREGFKKS